MSEKKMSEYEFLTLVGKWEEEMARRQSRVADRVGRDYFYNPLKEEYDRKCHERRDNEWRKGREKRHEEFIKNQINQNGIDYDYNPYKGLKDTPAKVHEYLKQRGLLNHKTTLWEALNGLCEAWLKYEAIHDAMDDGDGK